MIKKILTDKLISDIKRYEEKFMHIHSELEKLKVQEGVCLNEYSKLRKELEEVNRYNEELC